MATPQSSAAETTSNTAGSKSLGRSQWKSIEANQLQRVEDKFFETPDQWHCHADLETKETE